MQVNVKSEFLLTQALLPSFARPPRHGEGVHRLHLLQRGPQRGAPLGAPAISKFAIPRG